MRHLRLAFAAALVILSISAAHALPTMTGDPWKIHDSIDLAGNVWNGSTLVFTSQTANGTDADLVGYFDWIGSGGQFGRETFTGTLLANLTIKIFGNAIIQPASGLVTGSYSGTVSDDGSQIVNGQWSAIGAIPGTWEASRSVPEPNTAVLVALLCGLVVARRYLRVT